LNLTHISLAIATVSLGAALFQGYLNSRNLDVVQRDIARREHLRACKEAIEAYFDAKLRIERAAAEPGPERRFEARAAVARVGALGTYLANFQGEAMRVSYTGLTRELDRLALAPSPAAPGEAFARADGIFAELNQDCMRSTRFDG
jgi:hypothetical protein